MHISDTHRKALELIDADDFATARDMLEDALRGEESSWIVKNDLALCRFMLGDTEGAVEVLNQVLADYPENSFARINRFYVIEADKVRKAPRPDPGSKIREIRGQGPKSPLVTVIMPTYNRPSLIRESIESVLSQTMQDWELIVVNDGGDKGVERTLAEYPDPRIVYISAEHGGLSSALNVGLSQARGPWIAYLDDDDIFYPDHLETLVGFLESHPEVKAAYTDMYRAYQRRQGNSYRVAKRVLDYGQDLDQRRLRSGSQIPNRDPLMHHKSCTKEVGGFHEGLEYTMDWDFLLRLSRAFEVQHIRKITGEFRTRDDASQMTAMSGADRNSCRNTILYLNNICPLTGRLLRSQSRGHGRKLVKELDQVLKIRESMIRELELRKLWAEPYYALFYTLGKLRMKAGDNDEARIAFASARRLAPHEARIYFAWIRSWL
jgi:glycosyltransferase involved in cell wall biosynthesis